MIASHYGKQTARVGKCTLFDIFDPRAVNADGHFVFGLAGDGTRMAADALSVIYNEAEIHNGAKGKFILSAGYGLATGSR